MRRSLSLLLAIVAVASFLLPSAQAAGPRPLEFAPRGITTDRFPAATSFEREDVTAHDGVILLVARLPARHEQRPRLEDARHPRPLALLRRLKPATTLARWTSSSASRPRATPSSSPSVRGTGNSGGCLEQDGPNQAKDFTDARRALRRAAVVATARSAPTASPTTPRPRTPARSSIPKGLETMVTVAGISQPLRRRRTSTACPLTLSGLGQPPRPTCSTAWTSPADPPRRRRCSQRRGLSPGQLRERRRPAGRQDHLLGRARTSATASRTSTPASSTSRA